MSTMAFDSLFTGYPDSADTQQHKNQFWQALEHARLQLQRVRQNLLAVNPDNLEPVKDAISTLDWATLRLAPEMPPAALMSLDLLGRSPLLVASNTFNTAVSRKYGMFRRTGIITERELELCKRELYRAAEQILSWIDYVAPDSSLS